MKIKEITESFDSVVQGQLVRATNDHFTTSAVIGDRKIIFNASSYESENNNTPITIWEVEFTEKSNGTGSTYGKSGSGNELQVFSFVIDSINALVARYAPAEITFDSHKADGNRTSLYRRIGNRIKIPGYHLADVAMGSVSDTFRIVRDGIDSAQTK